MQFTNPHAFPITVAVLEEIYLIPPGESVSLPDTPTETETPASVEPADSEPAETVDLEPVEPETEALQPSQATPKGGRAKK